MLRTRLRTVLAGCALMATVVGIGFTSAYAQDAPPAQFQPGPAPEITSLNWMVGSWAVHARFQGPDGSIMEQDVDSSFSSMLDGCFVRGHLSYDFMGTTVTTESVHSFDRIRGVYRTVWFDSMMGLADVYEGSMSDGKLRADNLRSRTSFSDFNGGEFFTRFTLEKASNNKFTMAWESSADEGKNWMAMGTLTYTRK